MNEVNLNLSFFPWLSSGLTLLGPKYSLKVLNYLLVFILVASNKTLK